MVSTKTGAPPKKLMPYPSCPHLMFMFLNKINKQESKKRVIGRVREEEIRGGRGYGNGRGSGKEGLERGRGWEREGREGEVEGEREGERKTEESIEGGERGKGEREGREGRERGKEEREGREGRERGKVEKEGGEEGGRGKEKEVAKLKSPSVTRLLNGDHYHCLH